MRIKKGDQVKIIAGKDRGKTATVIHVFPEEARVTAEGVNLYKKRVRPHRAGEKGETVMVPRPLSASNVMLVCPNCKNPVRVGYRVEAGQKSRYCKKCSSRI